MAVLSTVPSIAARPCASPAKSQQKQFLQTVTAAVLASSDAMPVAELVEQSTGRQPQAFIFATEEVKVFAGRNKAGLISVSVPRFCTAKKLSPRCRERPPGLHICPPPGLTAQSESPASSGSNSEILSFLQVPLIFSDSAAPSADHWATEEEGKSSSASSDDIEELFKEIFSHVEDALEETSTRKAPPLPVLLSSRLQPSKLGSAPLYGTPLPRKVTGYQKTSATAQPFVSGRG
eukprot:TRINITY_DN109384_c0_g1_i1.p1 TRINITY_DN109384_c0_g1~~TRINITY_DN109384_c0_g1_i1.p1  ORF type:complete len:234 (-),score=48.97 TRINITY_DN109384_c0_g1_i1:145-846(-)